MKCTTAGLAALALLGSLLPALAANDESWVSHTGNDANSCIVSQPCATLPRAVSQTNPNGQVNIMDSGEFVSSSSLQLLHSITIVNQSGGNAVISVAGSTSGGIVIQALPSDAQSTVILRGLIIDGRGSGYGINFSGGTLIVEDCIIRNNVGSSGSGTGFGIKFASSGPGFLFVSNSTLIANGNGTTGAAVQIFPGGSGSARATFDHVKIMGNTFGIAADGSGSQNGINMTVADSVLSGNMQDGVVATTSPGQSPIGIMLKNVRSVNNVGYGVRTIGANVTGRVASSTITGNGTGVAAIGGAAMLTYGDNNVDANGTNGAFTGSIPTQ